LFLLALVVRAGLTSPELDEAPMIPTEKLDMGAGRNLEHEREPTCDRACVAMAVREVRRMGTMGCVVALQLLRRVEPARNSDHNIGKR
jgi:hypothetical protein